MSRHYSDENELVVQRTDLEPADPRDSRSAWQKFVDLIRTSIGLKPVYLAERWATAKVRQEEVDASVRLIKAKAEYERTMAEARKLEMEAEAIHAKGMAEAERIRLESELLLKASHPQVRRMLKARSIDTKKAMQDLMAVIEAIQSCGGLVEIDAPELAEGQLGAVKGSREVVKVWPVEPEEPPIQDKGASQDELPELPELDEDAPPPPYGLPSA